MFRKNNHWTILIWQIGALRVSQLDQSRHPHNYLLLSYRLVVFVSLLPSWLPEPLHDGIINTVMVHSGSCSLTTHRGYKQELQPNISPTAYITPSELHPLRSLPVLNWSSGGKNINAKHILLKKSLRIFGGTVWLRQCFWFYEVILKSIQNLSFPFVTATWGSWGLEVVPYSRKRLTTLNE